VIPDEYMGAKVGRDYNFSFEVYSCFKVWVVVCDAMLNLVIGELCFGIDIKGN
jgi:hypothetical protein